MIDKVRLNWLTMSATLNLEAGAPFIVIVFVLERCVYWMYRMSRMKKWKSGKGLYDLCVKGGFVGMM